MDFNMNVSIAMAVYNGEKYISAQIESILSQMRAKDELIISYNESIDKTLDIIQNYEANDKRIKIVICNENGVLPNFENALLQCHNEIIMLSDQDDIWMSNKIETILHIFSISKISAVIHEKIQVDKELNIIKYKNNRMYFQANITPAKILYKNPAQGSCMAFRKKILDLVIPFPSKIPMHDSWIAMIASRYGDVIFLNIPLILYRIHGENTAPKKHQNIIKMLSNRIMLFHSYIKRVYL